MKKYEYNVIGVMSGTSLDGLDIAHVRFEIKNAKWVYTILSTKHVAYDLDLKQMLSMALQLDRTKVNDLDEKYTVYLAREIGDFISENSLSNLDAVCSHGHTIFHRPDLGYTLQIGNLPVLADLLDQKVVCDFRVQDVLLGGQGAPLVPIGDMLLFDDFDACLNLGGFANISFTSVDKNRIAYDLCPVNTLLNKQAERVGLEYDNKGSLAIKGMVNVDLLAELNSIRFYALKSPKSLGVEFIHSYIAPILKKYELSVEDCLATLVEHIAIQIANGIYSVPGSRVLITGGGAKNEYLIERIKKYAPDYIFEVPSVELIDYKEAIIFAFLGVLKLREETNVLASVTGAKHDHCAGYIYEPFERVM